MSRLDEEAEIFLAYASEYTREREQPEDLESPVYALRAVFYRADTGDGVEYKSRLLGAIEYDRDMIEHMRQHLLVCYSNKSHVRTVARILAERCPVGKFATNVYEATLDELQNRFPGASWTLSGVRVAVLSEPPF